MGDAATPTLGPCCGCGRSGELVHNIVMLPREAPEGFQGWACIICDLPARGAIAVLCDECLEKPLVSCCGGRYPADGFRVPLDAFPVVPFKCNPDRHHDDMQPFGTPDEEH